MNSSSSSSRDDTFASATAVKALSSHTYAAHLHEDWVIGNVPHGGYVTSLFLRVAEKHFSTTLVRLNQPHTTGLHLSFLRRTRVGPGVFVVKDVKTGRQTSVVHIVLRQPEQEHDGAAKAESQGDDLVVGYLTHVATSTSFTSSTSSRTTTAAGPTYSTGWSLPSPPPPISISLLRPSSPALNLLAEANWIEHPSMPFSSFRRASKKCRFLFPRFGQQQRNGRPLGFLDQWLSLKSGETWDTAALGFVSDMFPQIVEALDVPGIYDVPDQASSSSSQSSSAKTSHVSSSSSDNNTKPTPQSAGHWYPTLILNLDIKKPLCAAPNGPQWLFSRVQAKEVRDGRYDLEVVILDEDGDVVALSHHVCLVLPAGRNTSRRKKNGKSDVEDKEAGAKL